MAYGPLPPMNYDDNPPLDDDFHARARPVGPGEAARLRAPLERIARGHEAGHPLKMELTTPELCSLYTE